METKAPAKRSIVVEKVQLFPLEVIESHILEVAPCLQLLLCGAHQIGSDLDFVQGWIPKMPFQGALIVVNSHTATVEGAFDGTIPQNAVFGIASVTNAILPESFPMTSPFAFPQMARDDNIAMYV